MVPTGFQLGRLWIYSDDIVFNGTRPRSHGIRQRATARSRTRSEILGEFLVRGGLHWRPPRWRLSNAVEKHRHINLELNSKATLRMSRANLKCRTTKARKSIPPKQFAVVEFPSDHTVDVAPSKWLSEDHLTCPFPVNPPSGFKKIQKDPTSTPDPKWPVWSVEVKKFYDDFTKANDKAKKLLKASYLDSSPNEEERGISPTSLEEEQGNHVVDISNLISPTIAFEDQRISALINEFRAFQAASLHGQLILQEEIRELKSLVLRNINSTATGSNNDAEIWALWPLLNPEALKQAEEQLKNPDIFRQQIRFLSRSGPYDMLSRPSIVNYHLWFITNLLCKFASQPIPEKFLLKKLFVVDLCEKYFEDAPPTSNLKSQLADKKLNSQIAKWLRDSINRGEEGKVNRAKHGNPKINEVATSEEEINRSVIPN
ncbi:hypothetical protein Fcan01_17363 [Folsomia candida]|uniref:Uncharacterized protein n=1 Tax=Folsomia candida TaxID=158441 RepID=A0A226DVL7_FOLCA|nr:hypothetical protein Fcan01_17363 [Folsomia candida]